MEIHKFANLVGSIKSILIFRGIVLCKNESVFVCVNFFTCCPTLLPSTFLYLEEGVLAKLGEVQKKGRNFEISTLSIDPIFFQQRQDHLRTNKLFFFKKKHFLPVTFF